MYRLQSSLEKYINLHVHTYSGVKGSRHVAVQKVMRISHANASKLLSLPKKSCSPKYSATSLQLILSRHHYLNCKTIGSKLHT